jgi:hypothetical protein
MRVQFLVAAVSGLALAACGSTDATEMEPTKSLEQEVLTPDISTYVTNGRVTVNFTGMLGTPSDWISIASQGAPANSYVRWSYTNGAVNGSIVFNNVLGGGPYVARAFYNWAGTKSYTIQQESAPFTLTTSATLSTSAPTYTIYNTIVANYTNLPTSPAPWLSIALSGSALNSYTSYKYTTGTANGSLSFNAPQTAGTYVVRAFYAGSYTLILESAPFTITQPPPPVVLPQADVEPNSAFSVGFQNFLGNTNDWIGIANPGAPSTSFILWKYTGGGATGSVTFANGLPAGTYEARGFFGNNYNIRASASFEIGGTVARISLGQSQVQGNGDSEGYISASADGRYVAFTSSASNLAAGDTNNRADVFVRDRTTGTTSIESVSSAEVLGDGTSVRASISSTGRYVAFISRSQNLTGADANGDVLDCFIRDRELGTTELVHVSGSGTQGNGDCWDASVSSDGRYVAFSSSSTNLVADDTNEFSDIFVRDRTGGSTTRVSVSSAGAVHFVRLERHDARWRQNHLAPRRVAARSADQHYDSRERRHLGWL